jgi:hypothetical protein
MKRKCNHRRGIGILPIRCVGLLMDLSDPSLCDFAQFESAGETPARPTAKMAVLRVK